MKIKFNSKKLIPNIGEYAKIIVSTMFVVYIVKDFLAKIFPFLGSLNTPWDLVVWVLLITYLKDIINIEVNKRDYFWENWKRF